MIEITNHLNEKQLPAIYRVWKVQLELGALTAQVNCSGRGIHVDTNDFATQVVLELPFEKHNLIEVTEQGDCKVYTPSGLRCPVYSRVEGNRLTLSNQASLLMKQGEELTVDNFVFLRHLAGLPYPQENFLVDIGLLQASSVYEFETGKFNYLKCSLTGGDARSKNEAIDCIFEIVRSQFSAGQPISVLVSGGYDSRLNLAMAHHFSELYGNHLSLYHEYKDEEEYRIAEAVASKIGLRLTVKKRTDFLPRNRSVFTNGGLIDLQSGFYRDNLVRWHKYLDWIQKENPNSYILGLGAEAHKGKYYNQIRSVEHDSLGTLGANVGSVKGIAKCLGLRCTEHSQLAFFQGLLNSAREFESVSSQVDFMHYQTYICNGYGKRCHDLFQIFDMSFPFLNPEFLKIVFALPREEKEGFEIVKSGIRKLNSQLMDIPFTSANQKSLETTKNNSVLRVGKQFRHLAGRYTRAIFPVRAKGRSKLAENEMNLLEKFDPSSEVTQTLKGLLPLKWRTVPRLQLDYLMEAVLYMDHCEKNRGVKFRFER